jgi:UDP-glucuronate 4-epimerase
MALYKFTRAILAGETIEIYNCGQMMRDFTYIDDIVEGLIRVSEKPATPNLAFDPVNPDPATSKAPYRVFNIGNSQCTPLMDYIYALETALGCVAIKSFLPMQPGDIVATAANTDDLQAWVDFKPNTPVSVGVTKFVNWYRTFNSIGS